MKEAFHRGRRILKTDEFSSVFRMRPVNRTTHFVLYAKPNQLPHARLGLVVAKRFAPRAVTRNAIKRMAREIFRVASLRHCDFLIRLSAPAVPRSAPATSSSLKAEMEQELRSLLSSHLLETIDSKTKPANGLSN